MNRPVCTLIAATALAVATHFWPGSPGAPTPEEKPPEAGILRVHVEIPRQSLDTFARLATSIVHGRVAATTTSPWSDGVQTAVEFEVLEWIKGAGGPAVTPVIAGGAGGSRTMIVDEAPVLAAGDELILFLWQAPSSLSPGILGLRQGTYHVRTAGDGRRIVQGTHAEDGPPLDDFLTQLRGLSAVAGSRKEGR